MSSSSGMDGDLFGSDNGDDQDVEVIDPPEYTKTV